MPLGTNNGSEFRPLLMGDEIDSATRSASACASIGSFDYTWFDVLSTVQNSACGRGYLRAADVSSFCTLADGVVGQMLYCTDNGRLAFTKGAGERPVDHL